MTEQVKTHVENHTKSDISTFPGGLTNGLQPADVSWNKAFKIAYHQPSLPTVGEKSLGLCSY